MKGCDIWVKAIDEANAEKSIAALTVNIVLGRGANMR
jgi:hypothetical protein